jgi:hypothetical protein
VTATAILDLERAGFTREQVEALARLLETQLATKADLAGLATKAELAEAKADLIRWTVGVSFAQAVTLIGAVFAMLKLFPGRHP